MFNPIDRETLQRVLADCGVYTSLAALRHDSRYDAAGDTLYLARELEAVSAQTYEILTDPLVGRQIVPFSWSVPEGAETFSYDYYDGFAQAEWISNYGVSVGNSDAFKTRVSHSMRDFGSNYHYSQQDLARAAFAATGRGLDRERARFARLSHEQFIDDLVAVGDATRNIPGITNLDDFSILTPTAPVVGTWDTSTEPVDLVKDVTKLWYTPEQASKGNFKANKLVMPLVVKPLLTQPYVTAAGVITTRTVQQVLLENLEGLSSIQYWSRLDTASAVGGGGPRALAFQSDPMVLEFLGSYDYREEPPQKIHRLFQIDTTARVGGLAIRYPLAMAMMDLDASP